MPNDNVPEPTGLPIERYWLWLGRFVHEFAAMENMMQMFLMYETGVGQDIAKAIYSGVRIDAAKSYIKRTREVKSKPTSALLDRTFAQMTVITKARNDILHHGASFKSGEAEGFVTNRLMAMPGRETQFPVSPEILFSLTTDISTICAALATVMIEDTPIPKEVKASLGRIADAPWRYKSP